MKEKNSNDVFLVMKDGNSDSLKRVVAPKDFQIGTESQPAELHLTGRLSHSTSIARMTAGQTISYPSDATIFCVKTSGAGIVTVILPQRPRTGQTCYVKDSAGNAAACKLSVKSADGTKIDGLVTKDIAVAYGSMCFVWDSENWSTIGSAGETGPRGQQGMQGEMGKTGLTGFGPGVDYQSPDYGDWTFSTKGASNFLSVDTTAGMHDNSQAIVLTTGVTSSGGTYYAQMATGSYNEILQASIDYTITWHASLTPGQNVGFPYEGHANPAGNFFRAALTQCTLSTVHAISSTKFVAATVAHTTALSASVYVSTYNALATTFEEPLSGEAPNCTRFIDPLNAWYRMTIRTVPDPPDVDARVVCLQASKEGIIWSTLGREFIEGGTSRGSQLTSFRASDYILFSLTQVAGGEFQSSAVIQSFSLTTSDADL